MPFACFVCPQHPRGQIGGSLFFFRASYWYFITFCKGSSRGGAASRFLSSSSAACVKRFLYVGFSSAAPCCDPFPVKTWIFASMHGSGILSLSSPCARPPPPPPTTTFILLYVLFLRNARFLFCFFSRNKRMLGFFFLLLVRCSKSLFRFFFCNVCFLRKIKCILILKKTKLTLSSLFWWLEQPSLFHFLRFSPSHLLLLPTCPFVLPLERSESTSVCCFFFFLLLFYSFWQTWETQSSPDHLSFNALIFMKLKQWLWWRRWRPENVTCPRVLGLCYTQFIGLGTRQQFVRSADHPKP